MLMFTSFRIPALLSLAVGCLLISPVRGQPIRLAQPADADSASAVFASNAMLEAELADLRSRLDALDQANAVKLDDKDLGDSVCPGWLVSVDYLNWDVRQRGTDFAITTDDKADTSVRGSVHHLDMDRNSGVRTSLGYRTSSGWELALGYTYFQTDGVASVGINGFPEAMWATRSHPIRNEEALTADASGEFTYNVFDVEARYPLVRSCPVTVQIFGGLRWADIDQALRVAYNGSDFNDGQFSDVSSMTAFGLRLGAESQWHLTSSWSLFGNAAGSILYGRFHTALLETEVASTDTIVDVRDDYDQAVPVIEAAVGVAWNRGPWEIRGGYELANWFNLADRSMFPSLDHEGAYTPQSQDVLLDGLFVRFSFAR
jgi:hypothetical protein